MEQWRDIPGYEGLYQISIDTKEGKCKSLRTGKLLSNTPRKDGRMYWCLCKNLQQRVQQIARWIALTFPELVENEYFEGAEIDHKDTDPTNNHPSNLRWVTRSGNMNNPLTKKHNSQAQKGKTISFETRKKMSNANKGKKPSKTAITRTKETLSKPVRQYSLKGDYIATFSSLMEAYRITGVDYSNISSCCLGQRSCAGKKNGEKFVWKYA